MPVKLIPKGKGREDFSVDVMPKSYVPVLNEPLTRGKLKIFGIIASDITSTFPFVQSPLAPNEERSLIDSETGISLPFVVEAGKDFSFKSVVFSSDNPFRLTFYVDGNLIGQIISRSHELKAQESYAIEFKTSLIDPNLQYPHTIDIKLKNLGDNNLYGDFWVYGEIKG